MKNKTINNIYINGSKIAILLLGSNSFYNSNYNNSNIIIKENYVSCNDDNGFVYFIYIYFSIYIYILFISISFYVSINILFLLYRY